MSSSLRAFNPPGLEDRYESYKMVCTALEGEFACTLQDFDMAPKEAEDLLKKIERRPGHRNNFSDVLKALRLAAQEELRQAAAVPLKVTVHREGGGQLWLLPSERRLPEPTYIVFMRSSQHQPVVATLCAGS